MFAIRIKIGLAALLIAGFVAVRFPLLPGPIASAAAPPARQAVSRGNDLHGDPLPPGALVRLGTVRFRHPSGELLGVIFSRDGKTLLSAGAQDVRLWNASTGRLIRRLPLSGLYVSRAAFSANGRLIALAGFTRTRDADPPVVMIRILDVATGKEVRRFSRGPGSRSTVALVFTPDDKLLASQDGNGAVRLEEIATGTELLRQRFPGDVAGSLAFSPDGALLGVATGPNTRQVFVWEWQAGKAPRAIKVPPRGASSLAFSPNGKVLATGDDGEEGIRLWDATSGRQLHCLGDRTTWDVSQVCFSPDGRFLASTSHRQNALILWDVQMGKEVRRMAGIRSSVSHPVFSPDSRRLAAVVGDGVLRVWDAASGKDLVPDEASHRQAPSFVALLANGLAATGGDDGTVRLWDSATGRQRHVIEVSDHWVRGIAVSPDERWLATSQQGKDHAVRLWDLRTRREVYRLAGHGDLGGRRALAFTPDGKRLASWGDDRYLRLWEVRNGKALLEHSVTPDGKPAREDEDEIERMMRAFGEGVFSPDGSFLVEANQNSFLVVDVKTGKRTIEIANEGGHVIGLAVSPDGRSLLASTWGKPKLIRRPDGGQTSTTDNPLVCLYEIATGKVVRRITLPDRERRIGPVAFAADGKTFAVGEDKGIRFYRTRTGAACGAIDKAPGRIRSLAFSRDGKRIIAGLSDATAVIWDVPAN